MILRVFNLFFFRRTKLTVKGSRQFIMHQSWCQDISQRSPNITDQESNSEQFLKHVIIYDHQIWWSPTSIIFHHHIWWSPTSSYMIITYDHNIWSSYMIITYDHHTWSSYMIIIHDHITWSSYMIIIHDDHTWSSYMILIYDHHTWSSSIHSCDMFQARGSIRYGKIFGRI